MSGFLDVHFGGHAVRFHADEQLFLAPLAVHLKHCLDGTGPILTEFRVTAVSEAAFCVSENGSVFFPRLGLEAVLPVLMQEGLARLNGACALGPVFHAAALSDARGGVILCGQSGSGKSTLAAWLLAGGLGYLSDEVIVLDEEGQIGGFARSLVLKRGSAFLWRLLLGAGRRDGLLTFPDGSAWIEPSLLNKNGLSLRAVPRLLLFPRYAPDAPFRATQLTPAESLFRLLQTLVNARNLPHLGMEATARLARQVTSYSLEYSDLETATAWIRQA